MESNQNRRHYNKFIIGAIILITMTLFIITAYRSITWWQGCSYSLTASCLGIGNPPGSLLLTIIGWLFVSIIPAVSDAFLLNILAGIFTAITIAFIYKIATNLILNADRSLIEDKGMYLLSTLGTALIVLYFAFAPTIWNYSIQFNPYVLTAAFTAMILLAFLKWQSVSKDSNGLGWLFLVFLLIGLDFSVHRTNLLFFPGILLWILIVKPPIIGRIKAWLSGIGGLFLGLAFHFLIIPISMTKPYINMNDPSNLSRFYDYVSLKQYGGGWLVNLWPRKGDFWNIQCADYFNYFHNNLINIDGIFGVAGVIAVFLALSGLIYLFKNNWKNGLGLFILFLSSSLGAIIYFNLPENFYWPMDRHYIPSYLFFTIFTAVGFYTYAKLLYRLKNGSIILLIIAAVLPISQITHNYKNMDSSKKYFAYDYAYNILNSLESNAIVVSAGDDLWPLVYLNRIENVRPDVTVISSSLTNTPWYLSNLNEYYPDLPVHYDYETANELMPIAWNDSSVYFSFEGNPETFKLSDSESIPDSIEFKITPTYGDYIITMDRYFIELLKANKWHRPVYFVQPFKWMMPYSRFEGLVFQIMPMENPKINKKLLQDNFFEKYSYRSLNDPEIRINRFSGPVVTMYIKGIISLAIDDITAGDSEGYLRTMDFLRKVFPPERFRKSPELERMYDQAVSLNDSLKTIPEIP